MNQQKYLHHLLCPSHLRLHAADCNDGPVQGQHQNLNLAGGGEFGFYLFIKLGVLKIFALMLKIFAQEYLSSPGDVVKAKLPSYEECMMAAPLQCKLQVDVHTPAQNMGKTKLHTDDDC